MKIAFEMQPLLDSQKTGIGQYTENLVRRLVHNNPQTKFILEFFIFRNRDTVKAHISGYEAPNTDNRVCCFPRSVYRTVSAFFPLPYRWFFGSEADIRHFFNFIVPPFAKGKIVVTVHDMGFKRFPKTVRTKTRFLLRLGLGKSIRRADLIIADSAFTKREILCFYKCKPQKIQVVYPGVDKTSYHAHIAERPLEEPYILYLGTVEPRKNIERLIEAYAKFKKRHIDAPILVIAGKKGWFYEGIFQKVHTLGVTDFVRFTGFVDEKDKPGFLAGALFFCFPSLYEGFGLPPLEAMACGTPVIVSNTASLPEVVGDAGIQVDPFSVAELTDAMEKLWLDKALREHLSQKGLERAALFDWDNASKQLFALYEALAEGKLFD